jgi:hypothetical protein
MDEEEVTIGELSLRTGISIKMLEDAIRNRDTSFAVGLTIAADLGIAPGRLLDASEWPEPTRLAIETLIKNDESPPPWAPPTYGSLGRKEHHATQD